MISIRTTEKTEKNLAKLYGNKSLGGSRACMSFPNLFYRTKKELFNYFTYKELRLILKAYNEIKIQPQLSSKDNLMYIINDYCWMNDKEPTKIVEKIDSLCEAQAIVLLEDIYIYYNVKPSYHNLMSQFIYTYVEP